MTVVAVVVLAVAAVVVLAVAAVVILTVAAVVIMAVVIVVVVVLSPVAPPCPLQNWYKFPWLVELVLRVEDMILSESIYLPHLSIVVIWVPFLAF